MAVAVVMTLARTDDPTLQRWARSHRPHLHQLLAADRFVDGLPLVGGQHVSVIGNAASASTRVLRLVNLGVSCVWPRAPAVCWCGPVGSGRGLGLGTFLPRTS